MHPPSVPTMQPAKRFALPTAKPAFSLAVPVKPPTASVPTPVAAAMHADGTATDDLAYALALADGRMDSLANANTDSGEVAAQVRGVAGSLAFELRLLLSHATRPLLHQPAAASHASIKPPAPLALKKVRK